MMIQSGLAGNNAHAAERNRWGSAQCVVCANVCMRAPLRREAIRVTLIAACK